MIVKKRILPILSLVAAGLMLLSGCAASPVTTGTTTTDASGASATDVDRQADGYEDNEICVVNQLTTNTFMNWTLALDLPAGGYGEELLTPGSKSCKNGQLGSPYVEVSGEFMTEFEDGQTWHISARNQARHVPSILIYTESGPHPTRWGCSYGMDKAQTIVLDDGKYKFTLLRLRDFTASRYVVTVSLSDGVDNLKAAGCTIG